MVLLYHTPEENRETEGGWEERGGHTLLSSIVVLSFALVMVESLSSFFVVFSRFLCRWCHAVRVMGAGRACVGGGGVATGLKSSDL